jgi:hypothetical protein
MRTTFTKLHISAGRCAADSPPRPPPQPAEFDSSHRASVLHDVEDCAQNAGADANWQQDPRAKRRLHDQMRDIVGFARVVLGDRDLDEATTRGRFLPQLPGPPRQRADRDPGFGRERGETHAIAVTAGEDCGDFTPAG